jgi:CheY-like chemotaxis protein
MAEKKKIVLVEDDEDDIFLLKTAFEELDMLDRVVMFRNGQDAFQYLQSQTARPAIIISDLNMPVMNGFELLEALLQDDFFHGGHSNFVFLTTSDSTAIPEHQFDEDKFTFFTKGFSYNQIVETVSTIISKHSPHLN